MGHMVNSIGTYDEQDIKYITTQKNSDMQGKSPKTGRTFAIF